MIRDAPSSMAANARRRAERYWFEDGIPMIAGDLVGVAGGAGLVILDRFPFLLPVFFIVGLLGGPLVTRAILAAKERLTYPRTGYVDFQQPDVWHAIISVAVSTVLFEVIARALPESNEWYPAPVGVFMGATLLYAWHRLRLGCAGFLALISIALSICIPLVLTRNIVPAIAAYCAGMGAGLIISGVITYWSYSRNAPQAENAES